MVRVVKMVRVVNLHMGPEDNQFKTIRDGVALSYLLLTLFRAFPLPADGDPV